MSSLRIVSGSLELYDAELAEDKLEFARLLTVSVVEEWPPIGSEHDTHAVNFFRQMLAGDATLAPWLAYYVCADSALVGSAGFMGAPVEGMAEIGYSICKCYRRRGFATDAVRALVERAGEAGVDRLIAHTKPTNAGSIMVLERNGFVREQSDRDNYLLFARQG